jgi:hypothetical protein
MFKTAEETRHYYELAGFQKEALSPELKERARAEAQRRAGIHDELFRKHTQEGKWDARSKSFGDHLRRSRQEKVFAGQKVESSPRNLSSAAGAGERERAAAHAEKRMAGRAIRERAQRAGDGLGPAIDRINARTAEHAEQAASHAAPKVEQAAAKGMSNLGKGGLIAGGLGLAAAGAYGVHKYRSRPRSTAG